jgi:hypothetical protein
MIINNPKIKIIMQKLTSTPSINLNL